MTPNIGKAIATIGIWIGIGIATYKNGIRDNGVPFWGMIATIAVWSDGCGYG